MTAAYVTGTITLTNGSAAIVGSGTGWATAVIAGGVIYPAAAGNALPIAEIVDDTHITAAVPWAGASGTYAYALMRDTSYAEQTVANAQALATYIARLNNASLAAIASVAGSMAEDKLLYTVSDTTMDWTTLTSFARTLLDDTDAAAARVTLGNVFAKDLPLANTVLSAAAANFNAVAGSGFWQIDKGGGVANENAPSPSAHHLLLQVGTANRGLQIAGSYSEQGRLWMRNGNAAWGTTWTDVLTATAGAAVISTAGGSEADLTTSPAVRLSINFTATRSSILALASWAVQNTQTAEPWVTGKLMIQDLVTMSEFVAHEFSVNVPGTNSGRYHPSIPLLIAYSGLVIGRSYQLKLYVWKDVAVGPIYPRFMKITAINS